MAVFKYTFTSPPLSSSDSSGVDIRIGAFPWSPPRRAARDEVATVGTCGGMGWATSMGPIQL
jgi:hypothetical protein